ncbi:MAG: GNAT family N-acetyltransferase [Nitrososphaerota archaeon]|nr:GNAT family N-acetyltransferase [Nitrososphaerota archaeon]MDG7026035.1 GNAT family N-acetyltransferase [Nitrososphaerota archaeon]
MGVGRTVSAPRRRPACAVREATAADVRTLVSHRRKMWLDIGRDTPSSVREADRPYEAWVRRMMRSRRFVGFVATVGEEVAGSGAVWLREEQPRPGMAEGSAPYLLSMYTEPRFRRSGVATAIVKAAVRWSRTRGYRKLELHASKAGRSVYGALGFERTWEMRAEL